MMHLIKAKRAGLNGCRITSHRLFLRLHQLYGVRRVSCSLLTTKTKIFKICMDLSRYHVVICKSWLS